MNNPFDGMFPFNPKYLPDSFEEELQQRDAYGEDNPSEDPAIETENEFYPELPDGDLGSLDDFDE